MFRKVDEPCVFAARNVDVLIEPVCGSSVHQFATRLFVKHAGDRALRYVERNPVRAGLVETASDYRWSSAAAHCGLRADPLLAQLPLEADFIPDWAVRLAVEDAVITEMVRRRTHTGRPVGSPEFLTHLETILGRAVAAGKRGPKTKRTVAEQTTRIIK